MRDSIRAIRQTAKAERSAELLTVENTVKWNPGLSAKDLWFRLGGKGDVNAVQSKLEELQELGTCELRGGLWYYCGEEARPTSQRQTSQRSTSQRSSAAAPQEAAAEPPVVAPAAAPMEPPLRTKASEPPVEAAEPLPEKAVQVLTAMRTVESFVLETMAEKIIGDAFQDLAEWAGVPHWYDPKEVQTALAAREEELSKQLAEAREEARAAKEEIKRIQEGLKALFPQRS